jgi:DNA-directed RNA polymerase subunit H (RpoH/RPB5)
MSIERTFELVDQLYRSRKTILKILEDRHYNVKPYENFGPNEIEAMLVATATNKDKDKETGSAFRIDVEREKPADSPIRKCRVMYVFNKLKSRLAGFMKNITSDDGPDYIDPSDTELIVILAHPEGETVVETYHSEAYKQWSDPKRKFRISFFRIANLVIHPSSHTLVPKHEYLPKKEAEALFSSTERLKLPFIRFHEDMQARILGLVPGDIVKITRPSPSSGEYVIYRICA